jgi:hypothetical protein
MSRRLLKAVGGRGLYKTTHPEFGTWTSWEPLPSPDIDQPIRPLVPAGPAEVPMSLHGDPNANRDAQRRRRVDLMLKSHGLGPLRDTW